jgi:hypothetical protein
MQFDGVFLLPIHSESKQGVRGLLASLISQLCATTSFLTYFRGSHRSEDDALMRCPNSPSAHKSLLCACLNTGIGCREQVFEFVQELVSLRPPNLRTVYMRH